MEATTVPSALRERLGEEATHGLVKLFDIAGQECVETVTTRSIDRFERRLVEEISRLRVEIVHGDAALRQGMAGLRTDLRQEIATQRFELSSGPSSSGSVWSSLSPALSECCFECPGADQTVAAPFFTRRAAFADS